jgi:hypothetical protein
MSRGSSLCRRGAGRMVAATTLALVAGLAFVAAQAGSAVAGVLGGTSVTASLTAPSTVEVDQPFTVSWQTSSPSSYDWIGVYRVGAPDSDWLASDWFYTSSCGRSIGTAKASGSCSVNPGLAASVDYEFRLFHNGSFTRIATSAPLHAVDTTPSSFEDISASSVATSDPTPEEVVSWTTSEFTDTQVEYGQTASYGNSTTLGTNLSSIHKQYLSGLAFNTLYHYRVKGRDASGNLAVSPDATFTTAGPPAGPTISATPTAVIPGGATTVSWSGVSSPTTSDWVGLYKSGAADGAYTKWFYTGTCASFTSSTKAGGGSCSVTMPAVGGTYEFRLFAAGGYTRLATSAPVTVTGAILSVTPATVAAGGSITVAWQGITSATGMDWIGVYRTGQNNANFTKWFYVGTCGLGPGTAKASGSCTVTMPTTPGTYVLRLFRNGGYAQLATSDSVNVTAISG